MGLKSSVFALLPRRGLANRLFVWAHANVFAKKNQLPVFTHGWGHIHIGPWLRGEPSKRFYYFFFTPKTNFTGYLWRFIRMKLSDHVFVEEPEFADHSNQDGTTFLFTKVPDRTDYFANLRGSEEYLRGELVKALRPAYRSAVEEVKAYPVALHVRRGDFYSGRSELTPEEYFIEIVEKLRSRLNIENEIRVFSDALPSELPKLLALPQVTMADKKPDIVELFEISKADIIVTSLGSTFGYWAAFISGADVILSQQHAFGRIRSTNVAGQFEGSIDDYLTYRENLQV